MTDEHKAETPAEGTEEQPDVLTSSDLNMAIEEACNSKAVEFRMLGYESVTGADVWNCVSSKYKKGLPPLHRLINDIYTLKSTAFMNWLMMQAYKG